MDVYRWTVHDIVLHLEDGLERCGVRGPERDENIEQQRCVALWGVQLLAGI